MRAHVQVPPHARCVALPRVRRAQWSLVAVALVSLFTAASLGAQSTNRASVLFTPAYQSWQFSDAVPVDSLRVSSASQIAAPFLIQLPLGARWSVSASGAAFTSTVSLESAAAGDTRTLTGLTDIRVRMSGRLIGDAFRLTLGVNVPTGPVGLSAQENDVVRIVAAPALGAQVAVPGTGFGGTVGVVAARTAGTWAWAAGASYEQRGSYSPIEAQIAGVTARTDFEPGSTIHVSLGADGLMGAHRLTFGVVGDVYGSDIIRTVASNGGSVSEEYQLGPTVLATAALHIANPRIRDLTIQLRDRFRSAFQDASGNTVDGSSGNYLDVGISGMIGRPGRPSLLLGADVRQHSGLPVDKNFIGAGLTEFGVTLGASFPTTSIDWRPMIRASQGTLKTGRIDTTMTGFFAGLTISSR